jgi:ABC-type uncharacterized transport system involved in gliding motility auxiliary subunit
MLGVLAVILIVVFSNWLMRSTPLGNRSLDLTEDKRHTLTNGTKAILGDLGTPVIIRYYATRKSEVMPRHVKNYMRRVDSLLSEYRGLAKGMIRIEHIDPLPDTDAEDSANLDGISGQRIDDENLYFGISLSCLNQQTSIPFLDPNDETMLEYHLSSAIANVSTFEKTTIGIMTTLPMAGTPAQQPGQQPQQPWIIYQLLQQRYDMQVLGMTPTQLEPEKTPVLLLVHPAGITTQTEYLIDQYLLKGGIVIAALDPYALTAPKGNPMAGEAATPKFSHLTHLLPAWGIGMDSTSVIADGKFASDFGDNRRMYAHLALSKEAIVSDDDIITRGFENLYFPLAAGFTINEDKGLKVDSLLKSSDEIILIAGNSASEPDPGLFSRHKPLGRSLDLVLRLQGKFTTAFPDGDPSKTKDEDAKKASSSISASQKESTVYLISDADFLFDVASFSSSPQGHMAINNNAALLENILDQCTGSKHLIGARSRAATTRPFTIVKEMETEFAKELREDVEKAREEMKDTIAMLQQLQEQQAKDNDVIPSEQDQKKYSELIAKELQLRRELREKEKSLRARKNQLYSKITWLTVGVTPTFIALVGFGVWLVRRKTTRAK